MRPKKNPRCRVRGGSRRADEQTNGWTDRRMDVPGEQFIAVPLTGHQKYAAIYPSLWKSHHYPNRAMASREGIGGTRRRGEACRT